MTTRILFFTQPGCFSCELMKLFLDAKDIVFEECDISKDLEARRQMTEQYSSHETPTLVILSSSGREIVVGFDPIRLDQLLNPAPSSDSVTES